MSVRFPNKNIHFGYLLGGIVLIRAYFNAVIPLTDKTEARYSEIARLMVETGNWVVLQIDHGIPFWAKPPLSTWASAASMSLFGNHEFFVRLPYLVVSVFMVLWVALLVSKKRNYWFTALVLFSLPEFYLHAGVVSTDVMLNLSVVIVMLSFWKMQLENAKQFWRFLFFSGMGIGLLAKGPIVGILTLPPILMWIFYQKKGLANLRKIVWLPGIAVMLVISIPWYYWAEVRSPGFVDYFIVGEHFKRYFDSGWAGDKYGFPKQQPFGIIWVFLLAFALPWSILLIRILIKKLRSLLKNRWTAFLLFWLLWTPLFFSVSKSLIHPYTLPVMIPLGLLIVHFWETVRFKKVYVYTSVAWPIMLLLVFAFGQIPIDDFSDKYLMTGITKEAPLYALKKKSYSSQFYSNGKIKTIELNALDEYMMQGTPFYLMVEHGQYRKLPIPLQKKLQLKRQNAKKGMYFFSSQ